MRMFAIAHASSSTNREPKLISKHKLDATKIMDMQAIL